MRTEATKPNVEYHSHSCQTAKSQPAPRINIHVEKDVKPRSEKPHASVAELIVMLNKSANVVTTTS